MSYKGEISERCKAKPPTYISPKYDNQFTSSLTEIKALDVERRIDKGIRIILLNIVKIKICPLIICLEKHAWGKHFQGNHLYIDFEKLNTQSLLPLRTS